jgi:hypothetical protein
VKKWLASGVLATVVVAQARLAKGMLRAQRRRESLCRFCLQGASILYGERSYRQDVTMRCSATPSKCAALTRNGRDRCSVYITPYVKYHHHHCNLPRRWRYMTWVMTSDCQGYWGPTRNCQRMASPASGFYVPRFLRKAGKRG